MAKRNREPKRTRRSRSSRDYNDKESERNETTSRDIEERVHKNYFLNFNVNQKFKLNDTHESFTSMAMNNKTKMSIIDGRAGSGKTYLSVYAALQALQKQQVEEIVYIRSVVESASKGMGFLPGEADEKFLPWMYPLFDKLQELLDPTAAKKLVEAGVIRGMPVNFVRGATFRNACVIIDEAQNLTKAELVTILTRIGDNCKYFVIGDTMQSDIGNKSGFPGIFNAFNDYISERKGIFTYEFTAMDVVRSEILKYIVGKLEEVN